MGSILRDISTHLLSSDSLYESSSRRINHLEDFWYTHQNEIYTPFADPGNHESLLHLQESLMLLLEIGDLGGYATAYRYMGYVSYLDRQLEHAKSLSEQSLSYTHPIFLTVSPSPPREGGKGE
jgi:hypothetical protein